MKANVDRFNRVVLLYLAMIGGGALLDKINRSFDPSLIERFFDWLIR